VFVLCEMKENEKRKKASFYLSEQRVKSHCFKAI
jgi:hypothetical protein